jgi:hypothetical protein
MVNVDDDFQLGPAAMDATVTQLSPRNPLWQSLPPQQMPELVTRNTFLECPNSYFFHQQQSNRRRAVSEGTGRKLLEGRILRDGSPLPVSASDNESLASGLIEQSTSTGGDGPSEFSDVEQTQMWEHSRAWPPVTQYAWVPPSGFEKLVMRQHPPPTTMHYVPPSMWIRGPAGPGMFSELSHAERVHNRSLWS